MHVARKFTAVAAAAGLTVAGLAILPAAPAGAAPVAISLSCGGDDSVLAGSLAGTPLASQDILNTLGSLATPPIPPPNVLSLTATVDATVPQTLGVGETGQASFSTTVALPQSLIDSALGFGVTSINVVNTTLGVNLVNGTGGPIIGTPPNTTIDITTTPVVFPVYGPFTATVGPTTPGTDILYNVGTVQFGTTLTVVGLGDVAIGLSCTVVGSPQIGVTTVTGTAPTTAAPTTAAPAPRVATRPKFTG